MALKTIHYKNQEFSVSYELVNSSKTKDFVVLHGWGSNKNLMKQSFSTTLPEFRHIYVDLPGFGKSTTEVTLTTQDYANIIELFLDELNSSKDIVLGHSFGGKVAVLLKPKLLVLVGSAGVVLPKPLGIKIKIALFKVLKNLGLAKFRSFFVAQDAQNLSQHMYETFKNVVDEDFIPHFKNFPNKALLFWGKEDTATPLQAAKTIDSLLPNEHKLYLYDGDHYFFMQQSKEIAKEIEEFLK